MPRCFVLGAADAKAVNRGGPDSFHRFGSNFSPACFSGTVSLAHFAHSTKKKKGIFEKFLCVSAEVNQALESFKLRHRIVECRGFRRREVKRSHRCREQ